MGKGPGLPRLVTPCVLGLMVAAALCACGKPRLDLPIWQDDLELGVTHALAGYRGHFWLTWNGARIGDAVETLTTTQAGLRYERRERITIRRGEVLVHTETAISVDTDAALSAQAIVLWQISGDAVVRGEARKNAAGNWVIHYGDEPVRTVPGNAVPAELVPLMLAADPDRAGFTGVVILPGYGFASARLTARRTGERAAIAVLHTPHGLMRGRYTLSHDRTVARVIGDDGIGASRVDPADLDTPFVPPEVVDSASVPLIAGALTPETPEDELVVYLAGAARSLPPVLPGQEVERVQADEVAVPAHARLGPETDLWRVRLRRDPLGLPRARLAGSLPDLPPGDVSIYIDRESGMAGAAATGTDMDREAELARLADEIVTAALRSPAVEAFPDGTNGEGDADGHARSRATISALARATAELLVDDLGSSPAGARQALALGRGDCTAHAALFVALARARGLEAHLVTGYRADSDRLVRHRWAIARAGNRWLTVDPTFGEAPATARLIGLAVHSADAAAAALVNDTAFAGLAQARAWLAPE